MAETRGPRGSSSGSKGGSSGNGGARDAGSLIRGADRGVAGEGQEPGLEMRMAQEVRRISAQHRQLDLFYGLVMDALRDGHLRAARAGFVRFRDALEAHVSLEDRVFFPALHGLSPEHEQELTALIRDHEQIHQDLESLHELLAEGALESARDGLDRFASWLAEHESREESLLERVTGHTAVDRE